MNNKCGDCKNFSSWKQILRMDIEDDKTGICQISKNEKSIKDNGCDLIILICRKCLEEIKVYMHDLDLCYECSCCQKKIARMIYFDDRETTEARNSKIFKIK
jgi:hypothetical protein